MDIETCYNKDALLEAAEAEKLNKKSGKLFKKRTKAAFSIPRKTKLRLDQTITPKSDKLHEIINNKNTEKRTL